VPGGDAAADALEQVTGALATPEVKEPRA
jgi:hypothetical protein